VTTAPRRASRFAALAATGLLLAACVTPATGRDSYSDKAVTSVRAAISEVQTARLVLQLLSRHRILSPFADETLTANEEAVGSISATFGSVQPPRGDDELRDAVAALLSDAEDAIGHARIAARRSDRTGTGDATKELRAAARALARAEERLS
jgi:hypothetical protein